MGKGPDLKPRKAYVPVPKAAALTGARIINEAHCRETMGETKARYRAILRARVDRQLAALPAGWSDQPVQTVVAGTGLVRA